LGPVFERRVSLRDGKAVRRRVRTGRIELQHQLVGLDAPFVVGLLVERLARALTIPPRELVAARLDEEAVDSSALFFVIFGEDLDEVTSELRACSSSSCFRFTAETRSPASVTWKTCKNLFAASSLRPSRHWHHALLKSASP